MRSTVNRHRSREVELPLQSLIGGVDYSVPMQDLDPTKLFVATNLYYDINDGKLKTRPGLVRVTDTAIPDLRDVYVETVQGTQYVLVTSTTKLYKLVGSSLVEIGALSNTSGTAVTTVAAFIDNLYIASGAKLQKWDGTTLYTDGGAWSPGAPDCGIVIAKSARLFVNDVDTKDLIKASGVINDTTFAYPDGITFRAGWRDGDGVVAMHPLADDLVIFKGPNKRSIHVLKGIYPNWDMVEIVRGSGAIATKAINRVGADVLVLDRDGLNSVSGTIEYGDFRADPVGIEVAGPMTAQLDSTGFIVSWPDQAILLCFPNGVNSVAHVLHYHTVPPNPKWRWTRFDFGVPRMRGGAYDSVNKKLYLVSDDGYLYSMQQDPYGGTVYTDAGSAFTQSVRTKLFDVPRQQLLLKRFNAHLEPMAAGSGALYAYINDGNVEKQLKTFTIVPDTVDINDVTVDEDEGLIGMTDPGVPVRSRQTLRANNLQLGIEITSGAAVINRLYAAAAIVGRE